MFHFIDKHFGKLFLIVVLIVTTFVAIKYFAPEKPKEENLSASYIAKEQTLMGSASNSVSWPRVASFANNTTTDASNSFAVSVQTGYLDGGSNIVQSIPTVGIEWVNLNIQINGGTASSTAYIKQQTSSDETNWFDVRASSTPSLVGGYSTTTPLEINKYAGVTFDPGKSTTTVSLPFYVYGSKFTRFIFYADDLLTDPADGIQGFVQAVLIDPIVR